MAGQLNIAAGLQRDLILNTIERALQRNLLPLSMFSHIFSDVPLQGTNVVQVPFLPLNATSSLDFTDGTGYDFSAAGATLQTKPVTVNKRKYIPLAYTSQELSRNPILRIATPEKLLQIKAEKLAEDVITDIFSAVVAASYGAAAFTGAASAFDSDNIADVGLAADNAQWPKSGRSMVLNSTYHTALLKDNSIKAAYAYGDSGAIRDGVVPRVNGFDMHDSPLVPTNGENLIGFTTLPFALCLATAPIEPTPEVMSKLSDYATWTLAHPALAGITLTYRCWGDPDLDTSKAEVELAYGYGLGDTAQLLRMASA